MMSILDSAIKDEKERKEKMDIEEEEGGKKDGCNKSSEEEGRRFWRG